MDCAVNNVRSGEKKKKKRYLIPKADNLWYAEEVGNLFNFRTPR